MALALEYLEEALEEAEAAAGWYAERSPTAAAAFSDEIDAAESATFDCLKRGHRLITERADISCDGSRSASSIELNPIGFYGVGSSHVQYHLRVDRGEQANRFLPFVEAAIYSSL